MEILESNVISIDWGTSSFRARELKSNGDILKIISTDEGILKSKDNFEKVLEKNLSTFTKNIPIIMSGMIGSKQGWFETKYLPLPCDSEVLARNISKVSSCLGDIFIIPGLYKADTKFDVMRGEETEIIGAIHRLNIRNASIVVTGTHSKVVTIKNGLIVDFNSYLTGEMFAALCKSSILGAFGNRVDIESEWFKLGVEVGYKSSNGGGLLNAIFQARSRVLVSDLPESYSASFLSGVLIGAEIGASTYLDEIWIMGNGNLPMAYEKAFTYLNFKVSLVPDNTVIWGSLEVFNKYKEINK
ncbi:2-dehydro-3-deoxygalactonokinase [Gallibacterium sp. AGMB14963]|uniref:2-dehydro-3-deoxygalactonokinase n=1 Tax=Gallibacterium faecale TaxID=3019086 RepID=UPI0022F158A4|nr:2-dehydro-3-deoxygalactonokinase [Gallibacterium sp. AGMB14963]MDA3979397.1 2-dehydro-3-deoxygalactonokinase [Gallibacterium sp. AGMB14963]